MSWAAVVLAIVGLPLGAWCVWQAFREFEASDDPDRGE